MRDLELTDDQILVKAFGAALAYTTPGQRLDAINMVRKVLGAAKPHPADGDEQVTRLIHAVEGECHGLAITKDQAVAILSYVCPPDTAVQSPAEAHEIGDVTWQQAADAIEAMDDCARMTIGVDASGPRETLYRFLEHAKAALANVQPKPAEAHAKPLAPPNLALAEALEEYWDAAWQEGREDRHHDTEDGRAQKALMAVYSAIYAAQPKGTAVVSLDLIRRAQQAINWHLEPDSPDEHEATMLELAAIGWPDSVPPTQAPAPGDESAGAEDPTFYLVLAPNGLEGVAFTDQADARYAATGRRSGFGVSTIAEAFRDTYEEADSFETVEVRATSQSPAVGDDREALFQALRDTQEACDVSQCPWCGCWGQSYAESEKPPDYCHHDQRLRPWRRFAKPPVQNKEQP